MRSNNMHTLSMRLVTYLIKYLGEFEFVFETILDYESGDHMGSFDAKNPPSKISCLGTFNPFLSCLRPAFKVEVCQPFFTLRNHNNFARSIWAIRSIKKANYLSHWDVVGGKPFFWTCGTPWSVFLVEGRGSKG
jgi:hypothetical protein